MTLGGYRQAGGVEGAIAQTAEATLNNLIRQNPEFEKVTREIFLDLTELGEGSEDTRRIGSREELSIGVDSGDLDTVLEELVTARLVTVDKEEIEVSHEALIRRWPKLKEWLEDNRERLRFERQLQRDVQHWERLGRDPGALYRGVELAQAQQWKEENPLDVGETIQEFFDRKYENLSTRARTAIRGIWYSSAGRSDIFNRLQPCYDRQ